MEAIGAGLGIATTVAPAIEMLGAAAHVVFRPLSDLSPLVFWAARREHDDRDHIVAFLEAATATLQAGPPAGI
jgi:DNA-binding transcriptional LysR family regulator